MTNASDGKNWALTNIYAHLFVILHRQSANIHYYVVRNRIHLHSQYHMLTGLLARNTDYAKKYFRIWNSWPEAIHTFQLNWFCHCANFMIKQIFLLNFIDIPRSQKQSVNTHVGSNDAIYTITVNNIFKALTCSIGQHHIHTAKKITNFFHRIKSTFWPCKLLLLQCISIFYYDLNGEEVNFLFSSIFWLS